MFNTLPSDEPDNLVPTPFSSNWVTSTVNLILSLSLALLVTSTVIGNLVVPLLMFISVNS